jgi:predicted nuclease with TOPRIM domain
MATKIYTNTKAEIKLAGEKLKIYLKMISSPKDSDNEENNRLAFENKEAKLEIGKLKQKIRQSESENSQLKLEIIKRNEKINPLKSGKKNLR